VQGVEVVLQAAGRDDEQAAGGAADAAECVRPVAGQEHERPGRRLELLAVAFDVQQAGEQVDALVLAGVLRGAPADQARPARTEPSMNVASEAIQTCRAPSRAVAQPDSGITLAKASM